MGVDPKFKNGITVPVITYPQAVQNIRHWDNNSEKATGVKVNKVWIR